VLLSSIFTSELTWDYFSFSNSKISPIYQYIFDFESVDVANGDPFALCFEHLLPWIHTLMVSYPTQTESKEVKYALPSRSFNRKSIVRIN
jgi:hypothetical protein